MVLRWSCAVGALAVLWASQASAQAPCAARGEMTLVSYAGIFQDNYDEAVIKPFQVRCPNVKVNYSAPGSSAQMLGMVRAQKNDPQTEVVIMDVTTSMLGNTEGLFDKLTEQEVPALKELFPDARQAGGEFGPAVTFDHLVVVYDARLLDPVPTSLKVLWDTDVRGFVGLYSPPNIQGLALTIMVNKMEGADWRRTIDPAVAKLRELAPHVVTFDPNPDGYTLILNGQLRASTGWNARAQAFRDMSQGRLGVLLPAEGSVFQINTINVTSRSKNRAAAIAFANYALGQEAQKAFTERLFYGPTNAQAKISPEALARTAASPENRARMIPVDWAEVVKVRDQWNNRWRREIVTGSR